MIDRADAALNPHSSPLARGLTTAAYIKTLGGNISTGVMDMANIPLVTVPHLGGIYGYSETNSAIARATKTIIQMSPIKRIQLASSIKPGSTDFINHKAFRSIDHIDFNDPKQQHLKYLEPLVNAAADAGELAHGYTKEMLRRANEDNVLSKAMHYVGALMDNGDLFRRQVTLLSTYELELQKLTKSKDFNKISPDILEKAAKNAVKTSEYLNGNNNPALASRFSQNDMGRILLMYRRYGVAMLYQQLRTAYNAIPRERPSNMTQAEWATYQHIARRQLAAQTGAAALFTGVKGLPIMAAVAALYNVFMAGSATYNGEELDYDSFDVALRKTLGEGVTSGLFDGVMNLAVSKRISLRPDDMLFGRFPTEDKDSTIWKLIEMFGGPVVGMFTSAEQGIKEMSNGHFERGLEKILPVAISNALLKAERYAMEGGATSLRGDMITELSPWNILMQGIGIAPASYMDQLALNEDLIGKRKYNERRSALLQRLYLAKRFNDYGEEANGHTDVDCKMEKEYTDDAVDVNPREPVFLALSEVQQPDRKSTRLNSSHT